MRILGISAVAIGLTALLLAGCESGAPATESVAAAAAPAEAAAKAERASRPLLYESPLDHPILAWNEALLSSVRQRPPRPTVITRQLFMAHAAMYDAWAAFETEAKGYYFEAAPPAGHVGDERAERIAVAHAAYGVAMHFFPEDRVRYLETAERLGIVLDPAAHDPATPAGLGNLSAEATLAARAEDGSNWRHNYADTTGYRPVNAAGPAALDPRTGFDPNRWQPLEVPTGEVLAPDGVPTVTAAKASYKVQAAMTPHWEQVAPFGLASAAEFRPPAPPRFGDFRPYVDARGRVTTGHQAWLDQFGELMAMSGWLDDPEIGPRWKCVAEFWADGPRTESPPGHWNQLGQGLVIRDRLDIGETAKLYFVLTGALMDAAIATWEAKFHYDYIRPQSAIRYQWGDRQILAWAGPNRGVHLIPGSEWQPYQESTFVTPAFPEYVSGHSTFSMAAATVLKTMLGSDTFYDPEHPTTIGLDIDDEPGPDVLGRHVIEGLMFEDFDGPPMTLQWPTLTAAAEEAGMSRLYGGIHIQDANLRGQEMGRAVGRRAIETARRYFEG